MKRTNMTLPHAVTIRLAIEEWQTAYTSIRTQQNPTNEDKIGQANVTLNNKRAFNSYRCVFWIRRFDRRDGVPVFVLDSEVFGSHSRKF